MSEICIHDLHNGIRVGDRLLKYAVYEHAPIGQILLALCLTRDQADLFLALLSHDRPRQKMITHEILRPVRTDFRRRPRRYRSKRH